MSNAISNSASTSTVLSSQFANMLLDAPQETKKTLWEIAAHAAIPTNTVNPKRKALLEDKRQQLVEFWLENNIQPIPLPEQLVIVYLDDNDDQIPRQLIGVLAQFAKLGLGCEFIAARHEVDKGEVVLRSASAKIRGRYVSQDVVIEATPYENKLHSELPQVYAHQFSDWFALFLNSQLQHLKAEQFAQLATILHTDMENTEGAKVLCAKDNNQGFQVDFAKMELAINGSGGIKGIRDCIAFNHYSASGKLPLLVTAIQIADPEFGSIPNKLNKIPNLLEPDQNYGVKLDSCDASYILTAETATPLTAVVEDELMGSINVWPWFVINNSGFDPGIVDTFLAEGGPVVTDKYCMKFIGNRVCAEAALIGRRIRVLADGTVVDEILTPHDVGTPDKIKESKALNRPMQARKHLKANQAEREPSGFKVQLSDGRVSSQWGRPLRTMLTNSRLCFGSGPAVVRPGLRFGISVPKSEDFKVNYDRLSKTVRKELEMSAGDAGNKQKGLDFLVDELLDQIEGHIDAGTVFAPGDVMVEAYGRKFHRNKHKAQHIRIVGIKEVVNFNPKGKEKGYKSESVRIFLEVEMVASSAWGKLRNDAVKLTTIPYPIKFEDGYDDWDIVLNLETQKGKLSQVILFVNANGGGTYYPNEGYLLMDDTDKFPELIDLTQTSNEVTEWVKNNMVVRHLTMDIAKREWEIISACWDTPDIQVADHGHYVTVTEEIQTLCGIHHYEYEISTSFENVGNAAMTLEQQAGVALQNKKLAERIYKENSIYRKAVRGLVDMISKVETKDYPKVLLHSATHRKLLKEKIGNLDGMSDRQIVDRYKKHFPKGVVFESKSSNAEVSGFNHLYLNFDVVSTMSTFIGGAADGISEDVVAFLNYIVELDDSSVESKIQGKVSLLRKSMRSWLESSIQSRKILQRAARTARFMVTGKVRTSYDPILNHEEGELPKLGINPNCPNLMGMATDIKGNIYPAYLDEEGSFDPQKMNGAIVCSSRSPMTMLGAFELILTENVEVGHQIVLPHVWSQLHEGDSDGDGFNDFNAECRGLTLEEALEMNESVNGMGGYALVYGDEPSGWPYAEFVSLADKQGKKALVPPEDKVYPYVLTIPTEKFAAMSKLVNAHYRGPVGTSYGICSALVFQGADMSYALDKGLGNENMMTLFQESNAIAWRLFYEGLGLAGYTQNAKKFFDILRVAVWSDKYRVLDGDITFPSKDLPEQEQELHLCVPELVKLANIDDLVLAKQIIKLSLKMAKLCTNRSALEFGLYRAKYLTTAEKVDTAVWTGLRAAGQGLDRAGVQDRDEVLDDEVKKMSLFTILQRSEGWNKLSCWWLREVLEDSTYIHRIVGKRLTILKNQDNIVQ